jgi:hypothetical protein
VFLWRAALLILLFYYCDILIFFRVIQDYTSFLYNKKKMSELIVDKIRVLEGYYGVNPEIGPSDIFASSGNIIVSGAGNEPVNGLYSPRGTYNGRLYYNLVGEPDELQSKSIIFTLAGTWVIWSSGLQADYSATSDAATPDLATEWTVIGFMVSPPAPTVTAEIKPINEVVDKIRIDKAEKTLSGSPVEYVIACSDETAALSAGAAKVTFRAPVKFKLTSVSASVNVAPTGSSLIVDINNQATSALSTKLSIDALAKTSESAAIPPVINADFSNFFEDSEITIDVDQIGSTVAGAGLKVVLQGTRM